MQVCPQHEQRRETDDPSRSVRAKVNQPADENGEEDPRDRLWAKRGVRNDEQCRERARSDGREGPKLEPMERERQDRDGDSRNEGEDVHRAHVADRAHEAVDQELAEPFVQRPRHPEPCEGVRIGPWELPVRDQLPGLDVPVVVGVPRAFRKERGIQEHPEHDHEEKDGVRQPAWHGVARVGFRHRGGV